MTRLHIKQSYFDWAEFPNETRGKPDTFLILDEIMGNPLHNRGHRIVLRENGAPMPMTAVSHAVKVVRIFQDVPFVFSARDTYTRVILASFLFVNDLVPYRHTFSFSLSLSLSLPNISLACFNQGFNDIFLQLFVVVLLTQRAKKTRPGLVVFDHHLPLIKCDYLDIIN